MGTNMPVITYQSGSSFHFCCIDRAVICHSAAAAMASFPTSFSHRHHPRSPGIVREGSSSSSPCTSPLTMSTGRLSTVTSPRLQLSPCPSSPGAGNATTVPASPRGPKLPPRKDTNTMVTGSRGSQRHSTGYRRVLSDTESSSLPVWRGANMAQSQLMQRRRRQIMKTQQKSHVWQPELQRSSVSTNKR